MDLSGIEVKKGLQISFARELRTYLLKVYSLPENDTSFDSALKELDALRAECIAASPLTPTYTALLQRYFAELRDLERRVDLDSAQIKVQFAWYNCAMGEDKKILVSSHDIRFEQAAIVFNLAAFHIVTGMREEMESSEGCKRAYNHFITAAGMVQWINEELSGKFLIPQPCDLSPASLQFLHKWLLAGAQACFIRKGQVEGASIKDAMLARLATATAVMFEGARGLGEPLAALPGSIVSRRWLAEMAAAALYYRALAQQRKANEALAGCRYGEEIARLNEATSVLTRLRDLRRQLPAGSRVLAQLETLSQQVIEALERALKDNNVIYHEPVPMASSLSETGTAIVAAAAPFVPPGTQSRPILSILCPERVYRRARTYYAYRNAMAQAVCEQARALDAEEMAMVQETNLTAVLRMIKDPLGDGALLRMGLPETIVEAAEEVRSMGGAEGLQGSLSTIGTLAEDARRLISEVSDLLRKEACEDQTSREAFGSDKWVRPRSAELSESLQSALASYEASMVTAAKSDKLLQAQLTESYAGIATLGGSRAELERAVPACTADSIESTCGDSEAARLIVALYEELARVQMARAEREMVVRKWMEADAVEEALPEEIIAEDAETDAAFEKWCRERCDSGPLGSWMFDLQGGHDAESRGRVNALRTAVSRYTASLDPSATLTARQAALATLTSAASSAKALSKHINEAGSFYAGILDLLQRLRDNAQDFAVSRGLEAGEMRESILRLQERLETSSRVSDHRASKSTASPMSAYPASHAAQYPAAQYPSGQYQAGQYQAGQYQTGQYQAGQYQAGQYPTGPVAPASYSAHGNAFNAQSLPNNTGYTHPSSFYPPNIIPHQAAPSTPPGAYAAYFPAAAPFPNTQPGPSQPPPPHDAGASTSGSWAPGMAVNYAPHPPADRP